ncbi:MAG: DUF3450 family protein [Opitutales bacterium]
MVFSSKLSRALALVGCIAVAAPSFAQQDPQVAETRALIQEWVETTNRIAEIRTEWQAERQALQATQEVLDAELEALGDKLEELQQKTTAADEEKAELSDERADLRARQTAVTQRIGQMEDRVLSLAGRFPTPLANTVKQLVTRIPRTEEDAEGLNPGLRLSNILGILQQAERFNTTLTYSLETKEIEGESPRCKVLYWGLAGAYFVTEGEENRVGGVGNPGPEGWTWTVIDGEAAAINSLIEVQQGEADPEFTTVPVSVE